MTPSSRQEIDQLIGERTSPIQLCLYGESFIEAADFLDAAIQANELKLRFPQIVLNLYAQGIELTLKALIFAENPNMNELKKYGHDLIKLWTTVNDRNYDIEMNSEECEHLQILNRLTGCYPYLSRYPIVGGLQIPDQSTISKLARKMIIVGKAELLPRR